VLHGMPVKMLVVHSIGTAIAVFSLKVILWQHQQHAYNWRQGSRPQANCRFAATVY
jgi:hypothetical protein